MVSEDSERGQKEQAAAASLELPDQRLSPKTKTKGTERRLANGPLTNGPPAHYLEPRELLHPVNKSDNSCPHRNLGLTGSKEWYVNYQTLGKQDALQARDISRPTDTRNTPADDPTPAGLSRQQELALVLLGHTSSTGGAPPLRSQSLHCVSALPTKGMGR